VLGSRDRDQRPRTGADLRETRAQQERGIPDEIGDVRERRSPVLLVADDGIAPAAGDRDVVARRLQVAPVEVGRVANDVIRPGFRRIAGVAVWQLVLFLLNSAIFMLLGLVFPGIVAVPVRSE